MPVAKEVAFETKLAVTVVGCTMKEELMEGAKGELTTWLTELAVADANVEYSVETMVPVGKLADSGKEVATVVGSMVPEPGVG